MTSVSLLAHRGASHIAPENTLAAFARALDDERADGIECDVRLSLDGVPIVFHDAELVRMTGAPGKLEALTAAAIADLRTLEGGEPIPTLADLVTLLAARPPTIVNVELKPSPRPKALTDACRPHLVELARTHRVIISSFDPRALMMLADVGVPLGLLFEDPAALRALPLLPPVDLHPGASLVTAESIAGWQAQSPGSILRVWTVDEPSEAQRLVALGVTSLITNRPGLLRAALGATESR